MSTSQNGFPGLSADSEYLHKWLIPGTRRYFLLRNGSAGFLLAHFALWYHQKVQRLDAPGSPWDEWGWAFRDIRGPSETLSNHASGTAVDLNATVYPRGTSHMSAWRKAKIRARLLLYAGALRWGGDYENSPKDQMHVEINRSLPFCEKVAKRLADTPRGQSILKANPGQRRIIYS